MFLILFKSTGDAPPPTPTPTTVTRYSCNEAIDGVYATASEGTSNLVYASCLEGEGT